jgi:hypothetical protein
MKSNCSDGNLKRAKLNYRAVNLNSLAEISFQLKEHQAMTFYVIEHEAGDQHPFIYWTWTLTLPGGAGIESAGSFQSKEACLKSIESLKTAAPDIPSADIEYKKKIG